MVKASGNHKKVLSRRRDVGCLALGKDFTLFFLCPWEVREPSSLGQELRPVTDGNKAEWQDQVWWGLKCQAEWILRAQCQITGHL